VFASKVFSKMLFDRFCAVCLYTCKTPKSDLTSFSQNSKLLKHILCSANNIRQAARR